MIYLRLLWLELKKYIKFLPLAIIGGLIPIAIIGLICFYGANYLYSNEAIVSAHVALVTEDIDEDYVDFALHYLSNMDSTSLALEFDEMSSKEAFWALQNGDVIAVVSFSREALDGLLYGNNIPVDITFSDDTSLSSVFLTELTKAGASFLAGAQASTYSISAIYVEANASEYLWDAYDSIDFINFSYVLSRDSIFLVDNGDFGGTNSILLYFAGSGLMLFFLLLGLAFSPCFSEKNKAFNELLNANRIKSFTLLLINSFSYFICLVIYMILVLFVLNKLSVNYKEVLSGISIGAGAFLHIICICFFISAYTSFLYSLSSKTHYGVLILFISTMVMAFVSCSILPRAFMPASITRIGRITGLSALHDCFVGLITGNHYGYFPLAMAGFLLIVLGCISTSIKSRQRSRG